MAGASLGVVIAAVAIYGALAITALRNRLLAKVAAREAIRRPLQSLLVVAGLTVGTGAILGPQIWSDSSADTLIAAAYRSWGRVDITVTAGGSYFPPDAAERLGADPALRTSIAGVQAGVDLIGSVANPSQRLGTSTVRIVGFDTGAQPAFGAYVLADGRRTYGDDLAAGEVVLSQSLADSLQAGLGDGVQVMVDGRMAEFMVAGIARPEGPGAYGLRPVLFAPLRTAQSLIGSDLINVVWMTARGDGQAEVEAARAAAPIVRRFVAAVTANRELEVHEVKALEVDAFTQQLEVNRVLFLVLGGLVMAVGGALVVNLVLSLAEERLPRLAVLRALGLSRSGLVSLSMLEGALYTVAAALASLVAGAVVAWIMIAVAAESALGAVNGRDIILEPSVRPTTVAAAVALGALITLATIFAAAVRSSRMTVATAIKELAEPRSTHRRPLILVTGFIALAVVGILALVVGDLPVRFVGGLTLIAAASATVAGRMSDRLRATLTGALLAAWGLVMLTGYNADSDDIGIALQLVFYGIVASVFGLSILIAANLRVLEVMTEGLGGTSAGLRATLRPPLAYTTRRPLRAGLTIGAFGLVVAMVTLLTILLIGARPDYERDSGGFDVVATSAGSASIGLPASVQAQTARVVSIPTRPYIGPQRAFGRGGAIEIDWHEQLVPLYELSDEMIKNPIAPLTSRDPSFSSDAEVWKAVATDPTWVITPWGPPGGTVWLYGRDGPVELKVAGSLAMGLLNGVAGSPQALAPWEGLPVGTSILIKGTPGVDPDALALELRRSLFGKGIDAQTTKAMLDDGQVRGRTFVSIFRMLIVIGLVVGVLSLGVLALRSVLERRRAIGVLRALGYQPRQILMGFLLEAMLTTALGVAVGIAAGLASTYLWLRGASATLTLPSIDALEVGSSLAFMSGSLLVVTILVSAGPALRAARLAPVEALRLVD